MPPPPPSLPLRLAPRNPPPKEAWIAATIEVFLALVADTDIEHYQHIAEFLTDLTDHDIDGAVRRALYSVLGPMYQDENPVQLALDYRDGKGNVWIAVNQWDFGKGRYVRKATLWSTVDACAGAGTEMEMGVVGLLGYGWGEKGFVPLLVPPRADWVRGWSLEECFEEYDVSEDEDWVMARGQG